MKSRCQLHPDPVRVWRKKSKTIDFYFKGLLFHTRPWQGGYIDYAIKNIKQNMKKRKRRIDQTEEERKSKKAKGMCLVRYSVYVAIIWALRIPAKTMLWMFNFPWCAINNNRDVGLGLADRSLGWQPVCESRPDQLIVVIACSTPYLILSCY